MFNPVDKLAELSEDIIHKAIRQGKIEFLHMQARWVLTELAGLDPEGRGQEALGVLEKGKGA